MLNFELKQVYYLVGRFGSGSFWLTQEVSCWHGLGSWRGKIDPWVFNCQIMYVLLADIFLVVLYYWTSCFLYLVIMKCSKTKSAQLLGCSTF